MLHPLASQCCQLLIRVKNNSMTIQIGLTVQVGKNKQHFVSIECISKDYKNVIIPM